jgi:2-oxoglutarate ferredoxin oxidoreductase subunit beta
MEHPGLAIIHVQSPCTTYNDTYEELKGNPKKGIEPLIWEIPEEHDPSDRAAAYALLQRRGLPLGIIYKDATRPTLQQRLEEIRGKARPRTVQQLLETYQF